MEKNTDPFQGLCDYIKSFIKKIISLSVSKNIFKLIQGLMMKKHDLQTHHHVFFSTIISFRVLSASKFTY